MQEEMRALREKQRQLKAAQQQKDRELAAAQKLSAGLQPQQQQPTTQQQVQQGQDDKQDNGTNNHAGSSTQQNSTRGAPGSNKQQPPTHGSIGQGLPVASCEVDVVAAGGSWWIEVKNQVGVHANVTSRRAGKIQHVACQHHEHRLSCGIR
jgi:hypothetical protein